MRPPSGIKFLQSFMNIGQLVQNVETGTDTRTQAAHYDNIRLFSFIKKELG
jgi:hypothetical protein